jgi:hypothetical protein
VVWRITIEWLDDEESKPEPVAHGRICHLEPEEAGLPLRSFHSYWEVEPNPRSTFDHPQSIHKLVSTSVVEDYPRFEGSIWDLVATMLVASGRGWPGLAPAQHEGG